MINDKASRMSELQQLIHRAILHVGGYWRPSAAVARLFEEMGELAEELHRDQVEEMGGIAEELADIWIITTCLANQFEVDLRNWPLPGDDASFATPAEELLALLREGGRLARIINYYDGPKNPRSVDDISPLGPTIAKIHQVLHRLGAGLGIDLESEVIEKSKITQDRDVKRFGQSFDPSTARSLEQFSPVMTGTQCRFAKGARLWGAPDWDTRKSVSGNVDTLVPYLFSFTKVAPVEGLDGFVVAPSWPLRGDTMSTLARSFYEFLRLTSQRDPKRSRCLSERIPEPGWQFVFNDVRLFVAVFSPLYPVKHPRYAHRQFFLLQPEASFTAHQIGSSNPGSFKIKTQIRDQFRNNGYSYPDDIIDGRVEAEIYLLPRWDGDVDCLWWTDPPGQHALFP